MLKRSLPHISKKILATRKRSQTVDTAGSDLHPPKSELCILLRVSGSHGDVLLHIL